MTERFKPYAAALTFLLRDDSVLLLRRHNTGWADGSYTVPSGHIDQNEPASIAAIRETKEEVNVDIDPTNIRFVHVMHRKNNANNRTYIDFFFIATKWSGSPVNNEVDKCDRLEWFKLDQLPENIIPFVSDALKYHIENIPYSEVDWKD